ncbi:MAG: metallophosphoesterase [Acidobacteriota bacterium]
MAVSLLPAGTFSCAQTTAAPGEVSVFSDRLLNKLALELRALGASALGESDGKKRADLVESLIETDPSRTLEFALALLESDPSPDVREAIIDEMEGNFDPRVRQALERRVALDDDPEIALLALEELRAQQIQSLAHLLDRRIDLARNRNDEKQLARLIGERQRWVALAKGAMLPSFLQQAPPVFSLKPPDQSIRVLAFGDFGDGSVFQQQVAAAMLQYHSKQPFDFAVTLGDNFYSKGMAGPSDPRWKTWWEDLYSSLGIQFYASLGNHDWGFPDSPATEVLYTRQGPSWRMPATRYTFTAGPVQFFALDTNGMSEAQLIWLREELSMSTARWKVVYGHHPIYSEGRHEDNENMIDELLPVLRDRADIYLAGHDHDMQHLKPEGALHFFIAGSGGKLRPVEPGPRSLFARSAHGFAVLEASVQELKVKFIDTELRQLYEYTLSK